MKKRTTTEACEPKEQMENGINRIFYRSLMSKKKNLSILSEQVVQCNVNVSPLRVKIAHGSLQQKGWKIGVSVAAH